MPHPLILQQTLKSFVAQLRSAAQQAEEEGDMPLATALGFAATWLTHAQALIAQRQRREIEQMDDPEDSRRAAGQSRRLVLTDRGKQELASSERGERHVQ
jgi:hypothetical protein